MNSDPAKRGHIVWWLLASSAVFCVLLPLYEESSIWGQWYTLGWPFPALALKIGYMSPESPTGPHLQFHPFFLLNAALWLGVFFGLRRAVQAGFFSRRFLLPIAVLAFLASGAVFAFGTVSVIITLSHSR